MKPRPTFRQRDVLICHGLTLGHAVCQENRPSDTGLTSVAIRMNNWGRWSAVLSEAQTVWRRVIR